MKRGIVPASAVGPFAESSCSRRMQTDVIATCRTGHVTIHHGHPFAVGEQDRNPLRRFRGRMMSPVSIWAAAANGVRAGWTLSSFLVAAGDPGEVIGLIDEESPLSDLLAETPTVTVNLLGWNQRALADAFAGVMPAPGGPFALPLGERPIGARYSRPRSAGLERACEPDPDHAGWGLLLRAVVERARDPIGPRRRPAVLRTRSIPLDHSVTSAP